MPQRFEFARRAGVLFASEDLIDRLINLSCEEPGLFPTFKILETRDFHFLPLDLFD
jgi:hypothetical protein